VGVRQRSCRLVDGSWTADLVLDGARGELLGPPDAAQQSAALRSVRLLAVAGRCAEALGAAEAALEMTVQHLRTRKQFGQPLGDYQALRHRVAEMYIALEQARSAAELAVEWGLDGDEDGDAKRIARALHGTIPVFVGAGLTASVAYRWKTQVNENAELPAFASKLPEHDHNEVVGWGGAEGRLGAVFLDDPGGDERALRRMEVTAEIAAGGAAVVERVTPRGDSRLERLVSLVLLGDLVSLYLAVLRGVDPMNVQAIDMLKRRLAASAPSGSR